MLLTINPSGRRLSATHNFRLITFCLQNSIDLRTHPTDSTSINKRNETIDSRLVFESFRWKHTTKQVLQVLNQFWLATTQFLVDCCFPVNLFFLSYFKCFSGCWNIGNMSCRFQSIRSLHVEMEFSCLPHGTLSNRLGFRPSFLVFFHFPNLLPSANVTSFESF